MRDNASPPPWQKGKGEHRRQVVSKDRQGNVTQSCRGGDRYSSRAFSVSTISQGELISPTNGEKERKKHEISTKTTNGGSRGCRQQVLLLFGKERGVTERCMEG